MLAPRFISGQVGMWRAAILGSGQLSLNPSPRASVFTLGSPREEPLKRNHRL